MNTIWLPEVLGHFLHFNATIISKTAFKLFKCIIIKEEWNGEESSRELVWKHSHSLIMVSMSALYVPWYIITTVSIWNTCLPSISSMTVSQLFHIFFLSPLCHIYKYILHFIFIFYFSFWRVVLREQPQYLLTIF